jgi:Sugar (and other) transporter
MHDGWLEVGSFLVFVVLGGSSFLAFSLGRFYSEADLVNNWRFILVGPALFSMFRIFGMFVGWGYKNRGNNRPGLQSPKWLLEKYWDKDLAPNGESTIKNLNSRNRVKKEIKTLLLNLYTCESIDLKIDEIILDYEVQNSKKKVTLKELFFGMYSRMVYLAISVNILLKFSGIDFMMFYSTDIFNKIAGKFNAIFKITKQRHPNLQSGNGSTVTFYMGGVQVLTALVGIYVFDKIGRRPMLIFGPMFQGLSLFLMYFLV